MLSNTAVTITDVSEETFSFAFGNEEITMFRSEFEAMVNGERSDTTFLLTQMAVRCSEVSASPDWTGWSDAIATAPFKR